MNLAQQKCVPCEGGMPPMADVDIQKNLPLVPTWTLKDGKLYKKFTFKDFKESMQFVSTVADIAERDAHHPDIEIFYDTVELTLWTHAVGGLSMNDFVVAAQVDELPSN